jgi:hypothetical protein
LELLPTSELLDAVVLESGLTTLLDSSLCMPATACATISANPVLADSPVALTPAGFAADFGTIIFATSSVANNSGFGRRAGVGFGGPCCRVTLTGPEEGPEATLFMGLDVIWDVDCGVGRFGTAYFGLGGFTARLSASFDFSAASKSSSELASTMGFDRTLTDAEPPRVPIARRGDLSHTTQHQAPALHQLRTPSQVTAPKLSRCVVFTAFALSNEVHRSQNAK